jgi:hypothetical protein
MTPTAATSGAGRHRTDVLSSTATHQARSAGSPGSRRAAGIRVRPLLSLRAAIAWAQCEVRPRRRGLQVPWYLLLNGTEPKWRLHATVDSTDLETSLARVMENGVIAYTLASRNEGELFQSLTINGKNLVTYLITEEADPDPAKTRSRYEAAGF